MMRRKQMSAWTSPVLIGAATLLAVLAAVFLAYNANAGLPFVPVKEINVEVRNGANLVVGNDVREGGFRVGLVSGLTPVRLPSGLVAARVTLKLEKAYGNVPIDSTASIRPASVLGAKYVDLHTGSSPILVPDGGTLPITQTHVPVQFDEIFQTFDAPTRRAIQENLIGISEALAGRGSALNDTLANLPILLGHLGPVARALSDPRTHLTGFLRSLEFLTGSLAPVSATASRLFTDMATTFTALSANPAALAASIAESPSTLAVGTASLAVQRPFLANLTILGEHLGPATAELQPTLQVVNPTIATAIPTLARTPILATNLEPVFTAINQLASAPATNEAINALASTTTTLNPMVRYLGPFQTVCDDWNYWWTYLSEHLSAQTSYGFAQRAMINLASPTGGSVGQQGATTPVNGTSGSDLPPLSVFGGQQFLHAQSYGAAVDASGNADCETGQRGWPLKLNQFDPQHRNLALDPHTPGNQGPTFRGRSRVPAGETFSRNPTSGPQLPTASSP